MWVDCLNLCFFSRLWLTLGRSVWGAPVADGDTVVTWSERVESLEAHIRRLQRALAAAAKLAPKGSAERAEMEDAIADLSSGGGGGSSSGSGQGNERFDDKATFGAHEVLKRMDGGSVDVGTLRRRSQAAAQPPTTTTWDEQPVIVVSPPPSSSSSEIHASHTQALPPANPSLLPSSSLPLPWPPVATAIAESEIGIEMQSMMDGAGEVADPRAWGVAHDE
jgi:hypothetical protein